MRGEFGHRSRINFNCTVEERTPGRPLIDDDALIGLFPQMREWEPGDDHYFPVFDEFCRVGALTAIDSGFSRPTRIGARTWIMKQVHVGHDCIIGADVEIASGTVLGGFAEVGDGSRIGLNCTILPYRKIGRDCHIGAGSVVTKNVPDGETWCGNPARPLERSDERPFSER